jgi:hypothetical protein
MIGQQVTVRTAFDDALFNYFPDLLARDLT